jgi:hypothetical protein
MRPSLRNLFLVVLSAAFVVQSRLAWPKCAETSIIDRIAQHDLTLVWSDRSSFSTGARLKVLRYHVEIDEFVVDQPSVSIVAERQ